MSEHRARNGLLRTRWAAIGAAIAVSLGAGGIGISHATTTSGERPIYLPIEPCRLADTRPAFNVGTRATPLGAAETYDIAGWGDVGNCELPDNTAGLALNVTAIDPSAPTFLTLFPAGTTLPLASHLNPTPGQPPTPNAVNVDLSAAGNFSIYNLAGNVHIAIDVVGIYDDHNHDDRYYTETEVDTALGAKANSADVYTKTQVDNAIAASSARAQSASEANVGDITGSEIVLSVTIEAPGPGVIQIVGSALIDFPVAAGQYRCFLTSGAGNTSNSGDLADTDRTVTLAENEEGQCNTNGATSVAAGTQVINLVLDDPAAAAEAFDDATLDAIFVPGGGLTALALPTGALDDGS